MSHYAEAAYFDRNHCAHVGVWEERQLRLRRKAAALADREKPRLVKFASPVHAMRAAIETRFAVRSCA